MIVNGSPFEDWRDIYGYQTQDDYWSISQQDELVACIDSLELQMMGIKPCS